jgi:multisubunit Na+/H+ antiporter MnhC subunit
MPLTTILVLTGIVLACATFGIVLAWAERQTRNLSQHRPVAAQGSALPRDDMKMAA